jgi:hypothetical protein
MKRNGCGLRVAGCETVLECGRNATAWERRRRVAAAYESGGWSRRAGEPAGGRRYTFRAEYPRFAFRV